MVHLMPLSDTVAAIGRTYGGTGPVVLKVVPLTGAAFSGITIDQLLCAFIFPHSLVGIVVMT